MIARDACRCSSCRARDDAAFVAIVAPLGEGFGWDAAAFQAEETSVSARVREYTESPRAVTPEDFAAWLDRILDRADRRREERDDV